MKTILLCSVFGPYGRDDEFSRALNPMELYHNQVTRGQGAFSLRMFHRSWGLMMIQANIQSPCVVLDFPSLERFVEEIREHQYDVIGISSIIPNLAKVKKMCQLIRQFQPQAVIVIGGHIANVPDLDRQIDADCIVRGEGVRWFREYLGENPDRPLNHPIVASGFGTRNLGVNPPDKPSDIAATVIPSVGCPLGCNFCSTSAMFGGKGKSVDFYHTGDELFEIMRQLESSMNVCSFFMMDENFLLHRRRALRLLELVEKHQKSWSLYVFSSANTIKSYSVDQLVRLGISWVWMGIEGCNSQYQKLTGINTFSLVRELQENGIRVLGSTIIGLENHAPENIGQAIKYAVQHNTDFHQFMLYTPIPGTPLYREMSDKGLMKAPGEYDPADIHGQSILNYRHPAFSDEQTAQAMVQAFQEDFLTNGPSTMRIVETMLKGWLKYKNHPDARIRNRFAWEARQLPTKFSAVVGAARLFFASNPVVQTKAARLAKELSSEFGAKSWLYATLGGRWLAYKCKQEERRLADGFVYEPPTFLERNQFVWDRPEANLCRFAKPLDVFSSSLLPIIS